MCGAVILSRTQLLTAAHCFFKQNSDYDASSVFSSGELQSIHESNIGFLGRWVVVPGVEYLDHISYAGADKYAVKDVSVHPKWDPKCSNSDFDVAIVTLKGQGMTAAQAQIVEIVSPAKDFLTQLSHTGWVMGWGKVSSADDAEEQKSLYLARASTNKEMSVCDDFYPGGSSKWSICSGPGTCEGDDASPLFYGDQNTENTNYKTILYGIESRSAGDGCSAASVFTNLAAVKDYICSEVPAAAGCPRGGLLNGTIGEADSLNADVICRWDAIDAHAKMMLVAIGLIGPLGIAVPLVTKHMTMPPKGSKQHKKNPYHFNYLNQVPRALYMHIILVMSAWLLIIVAVITVAVGISPLNGSQKQGFWLHSVIGYILFVTIFFQPILGMFNLVYGGKKWFPTILLRVHSFMGQMFVAFAMFIQVPLGLLKIGYGIAFFVLWFLYAFSLVTAYGIFVGMAAKMKLRVEDGEDEDEAAGEKEFARLENLNRSRRGSAVSNKSGASRRGSNVEAAKPAWAEEAAFQEELHIEKLEQKAERLKKRRMSMSDVLDIIAAGSIPTQLSKQPDPEYDDGGKLVVGAGSSKAARRRASISEGMEARMSTRRSSFAEAGRASLARRGSVAAEGRNSTYAGPRRASVDDSAPTQGRASVRVANRGTFRDMNG